MKADEERINSVVIGLKKSLFCFLFRKTFPLFIEFWLDSNFCLQSFKKMSLCFHLAYKVSDKESSVILPLFLCIQCIFFSPVSFKSLSLSLVFKYLTVMYLDVSLLVFILLEILWASLIFSLLFFFNFVYYQLLTYKSFSYPILSLPPFSFWD